MILKTIDDGAKTVKQIMKCTRAGTECGGCRETIKGILNEFFKDDSDKPLSKTVI